MKAENARTKRSAWTSAAMLTMLTNSSGGDVMPTISADEYKMAQAQKDTGGWHMCLYG